MWSACNRHVAVCFLTFPQAGTGEIEKSSMGKNGGIPHLVCKKDDSTTRRHWSLLYSLLEIGQQVSKLSC